MAPLKSGLFKGFDDSMKPICKSMAGVNGLDGLRFDNRFTRALPADPESGPRRRQVQRALYSRVTPARVARPALVAFSADVAESLGIPLETCRAPEFVEVFTGNRVLPGMDPHATCYAGHQFGNWAGQLGDGRAINLGELVNPRGERWMLQLKGAGQTPYSRTADGLAVLRSSIREFLCSEAMFHLGVPTTRALSVTVTGEQVMRDVLYDGHPAPEPGAVVCRVAPSFTRFGHFEMLAARGEVDLLRRFLDFTIATDFAHLDAAAADRKPIYLRWFAEVAERTAVMIVEWMRVGFVHGVMNTDNMSVLGLTIDYGPYGWLDDYDPSWTPNTTDAAGRRYRFANQPGIAQWNLLQLANAIYPLIEEAAPLEHVLTGFEAAYRERYRVMMAQKLGFRSFEAATDVALVEDLLEVLTLAETDMTLFFRALADLTPSTAPADRISALQHVYYMPAQLTAQTRDRTTRWLTDYLGRTARDGLPAEQRRASMNAVNPKYVLRNYLAQLAIDKAEAGDYSGVNDLLAVLRHPYAEQPEHAGLANQRPDWARTRVGCSMLSCSS